MCILFVIFFFHYLPSKFDGQWGAAAIKKMDLNCWWCYYASYGQMSLPIGLIIL
jgi:hypothetical protein